MSKCDQVQASLWELQSGEANPMERTWAESHIENCKACKEALSVFKGMERSANTRPEPLSDERKNDIWNAIKIDMASNDSIQNSVTVLPVKRKRFVWPRFRYDWALGITATAFAFFALFIVQPGEKQNGRFESEIPGVAIWTDDVEGLQVTQTEAASAVDFEEGRVVIAYDRPEKHAPLWVNTHGVRVKVIGTVFSVKHKIRSTTVSVEEGAVEVFAPGAEKVVVEAGEEVIIKRKNQPIKSRISADEKEAFEAAALPIPKKHQKQEAKAGTPVAPFAPPKTVPKATKPKAVKLASAPAEKLVQVDPAPEPEQVLETKKTTLPEKAWESGDYETARKHYRTAVKRASLREQREAFLSEWAAKERAKGFFASEVIPLAMLGISSNSKSAMTARLELGRIYHYQLSQPGLARVAYDSLINESSAAMWLRSEAALEKCRTLGDDDAARLPCYERWLKTYPASSAKSHIETLLEQAGAGK